MTDIRIFDRTQLRRQRDRAQPGLDRHDFLFRETASRLAERLGEVKRHFPLALDIGCHDGTLAGALAPLGLVDRLVQCDLSPAMAKRAARGGTPALAADEEALPFAPSCFDLVIGNLSMHWVNDLPGALVQIRHCLKEDGLLLISMLGGRTLTELRQVLMEAELAEEGGASPRISPFADIRDLGQLLQRAGFSLPMVDSDLISVAYADPMRLLFDLRGMGEANAVLARRKGCLRRATLAHALALYRERFPAGEDGRVTASFEVLTMTAWRPHAGQPRPLAPGSGKIDLSRALDG